MVDGCLRPPWKGESMTTPGARERRRQRMRLELVGSLRELWCYEGRREINGEDHYVWKRYLPLPDLKTGYWTIEYTHPVATFGLT